MTRTAPVVYTDPNDVQRIENLVHQLPVNARVRITERDGAVHEGIVTVTPTVQLFKTDDDNLEGINGVVDLEDPAQPGWHDDVWIGNIAAIEHLDSVTKDNTRA